MSRRVILAMLLVYVRCWRSMFVGWIIMRFGPSCVYMRGADKCWPFTIQFGHGGAARELRTSHVYSMWFFNVVLQELSPIDPHHWFIVGVFDCLNFDLAGLVSICVVKSVGLHTYMYIYIYIYIPLRLCFSILNFTMRLSKKMWFLMQFRIDMSRSRLYVKKCDACHAPCLCQWHVRISKLIISKSDRCSCIFFCSFDRHAWIINNDVVWNVNGIRVWGFLWNAIESCEVKLLILDWL